MGDVLAGRRLHQRRLDRYTRDRSSICRPRGNSRPIYICQRRSQGLLIALVGYTLHRVRRKKEVEAITRRLTLRLVVLRLRRMLVLIGAILIIYHGTLFRSTPAPPTIVTFRQSQYLTQIDSSLYRSCSASTSIAALHPRTCQIRQAAETAACRLPRI